MIRRIGRGGFGDVWSAQSRGGELVAVKILQPAGEMAEDETGPSTLDRFLTEGKVLERIRHPNIVRFNEVLDLRPHGPVAYVMELLEGTSLFKLQRRVDLGTLLSISRQIAEALDHVHTQGILHRDVKAGNIFICRGRNPNGTHPVKLLDFGIAKELRDVGNHTGAGMLVGTLRSLPPESIARLNGQADDLTGAVDQWGLGVTLYRTLYGKPPFDGDSMLTVMRAITEDPVRFDAPARDNFDVEMVQYELQELVARLLEKDPRHRFASMEAVAAELRALEGVVLDGMTIAGPRPTFQPTTTDTGVFIEIDFGDFEAIEDVSDEAPVETVRGSNEALLDTAPGRRALETDEQHFPRFEDAPDPAATEVQLEQPGFMDAVSLDEPTLIPGTQPPAWTDDATEVPGGPALGGDASMVAPANPQAFVPLPSVADTVRDVPLPIPGLEGATPIISADPSEQTAPPLERTRVWEDDRSEEVAPTTPSQPGLRRPIDPDSPVVGPASASVVASLPPTRGGPSPAAFLPPMMPQSPRSPPPGPPPGSAQAGGLPMTAWIAVVATVAVAFFFLGQWAGG